MVVVDTGSMDGRFSAGDTHHLVKPSRVYKHQGGNKTLRGLDVAAIGDGKAFSDNPMFVEGVVIVLQVGTHRVRVTGYARAGISGGRYKVSGWIAKSDASKSQGIA